MNSMGFRKLLEMTDRICKNELEDYYVISRSRMDNYIDCLEKGAKEIQRLTDAVYELQTALDAANHEIDALSQSLQESP